MLHSIPAGIVSFPSGYTIERALLFNGTNGFLNRTPSSSAATSARIFTMSVWLKRAEITDSTYDGYIFVCSPDEDGIALTQDDDKLAFRIEGSTYVMTAANQFRDPTAWFHLILRIDSTQSAAANRIRIYINGDQLTLTGTPPDQNYDYTRWLVDAKVQRVGYNGNTNKYYNGCMAEFAMYDGTSLGPDSFGETNDDTGIWTPIKIPTSGFGNNGFHLEFKQTGTSQNSSGIGADTSGATNHFAVNNLVAADQIEDSPSNDAGNNIGNYPTIGIRGTNAHAVSGANLIATGTDDPGTVQSAVCTQAISSGKFYWEVTLVSGTISSRIGIAVIGSRAANAPTDSIYVGNHAVDDTNWALNAWASGTNAGKIGHSASGSVAQASYADSATFAAGGVVGVALDMDNGALWFANDGTYLGADLSGSSAATITEVQNGTVTNAAVGPNSNCAVNFNLSSSVVVPIFTTDGVTAVTSINFGQKAFAQTIPSGFKRLMTANLPAPTAATGSTAVTKSTNFFGGIIYEGTGAELETGDTGVATLSFKPDWVWIKNRDATDSHVLYDCIRGATKDLHSDTTALETTTAQTLKSFDADGFTLGTDVQVNTNNESYVAWCWKAGGPPTADNSGGRTPTDGSVLKGDVAITTTNYLAASNISPTRMSIASHGGFSIVKYTSTGTVGHTLPHGLDAAPAWMIVKEITGSANGWAVYHDSAVSDHGGAPETGNLVLSAATKHANADATFNDTAPSATLVTFGDSSFVNRDGSSTYIAYFFSRVPGMQAFGGYVGNNNTNGPVVIVNDGAFGFKPAWLMIKESDADSTNWRIYDNVRDGFNPSDKYLRANTNEVDQTGGAVDFLSNGFKIKNSGAENNGSGDNYIYIAFAESPFIPNNRSK
jgi:hypothetical protein